MDLRAGRVMEWTSAFYFVRLHREKHPYGGPLSRGAFHEDHAVAGPDNPECHGHAQSPPREFGAEEGIEQPVQGFWVHDGAGI